MEGTMQTRNRSLFLLVVFLIISVFSYADKRTENIDIILALDESLSMGEELKMDAVVRYTNTWLLDDVLIPGDYLVVIAFYGKAEVLISETVNDEATKQKIKAKIAQIRGNGRFTDIGNALDAMKAQMDKYKDNGRKKFVLMMTDGIQEAPPYSKYYTNRTKYNYEFLENTKTIQRQGWKIEILGIGPEADVKDLAAQLQGSYAQITDTGSLSVDAIKAQTENLLGTIKLEDGVGVVRVGIGGAASIGCTLKSEGYSQPVTVTVTGVEIRLPSQTVSNALESPIGIDVGAEGTTRARIPVRLPADMAAGKYDGSIAFSFASGEVFNPSEVKAEFVVNSLVENYWWLALIALAALAVLVILIIFLIRFFTARPLRFHIFVDGEPLSVRPLSLASSGEIFINESEDDFSLVSKRNAKSITRFRMKEGTLGFDILKTERFPKTEGPAENVVGKSYVLRSLHGENKKLTIAAVESQKKPRPTATKEAEKPQPSVKLTMVKRSAASQKSTVMRKKAEGKPSSSTRISKSVSRRKKR
jgi:Mg-chelatase subunit ChlD